MTVLVLDANILIRAVLGSRVLLLFRKYAGHVEFLAPDTAFQEAREHLPVILERRRVRWLPRSRHWILWPSWRKQSNLKPTRALKQPPVSESIRRDEDDWPILAPALALGCPIWTEDTDFFGCGVATWTTDRVELYLENAVS